MAVARWSVVEVDSDEELTDAHPDISVAVEWRSPGLTITACSSRCPSGGWCRPHEDHRFGVALVRHGAWRRRVGRVEQFVDPNTGYFRRAGEIVEIAHFADEVHTGTVIDVDPELATPVLAEIEHASGPFVVSPQIDLAHRLLAATLRPEAPDRVEVEDRTLSLIAAVVSQKHPRFPCHTRRTTSTARRRLIVDVCEQLHQAPNGSLVELARAVHYSPFHLSRSFQEVMGLTISRYRTQLRVHEVLMRLDEGARDLNRLAAETGFADHSHMTRTVVAHLGQPPSALREQLRRPPA